MMPQPTAPTTKTYPYRARGRIRPALVALTCCVALTGVSAAAMPNQHTATTTPNLGGSIRASDAVSSRITITRTPPQQKAPTRAAAERLRQATEYVAQHRHDYGTPYLDKAGRLSVPATNDRTANTFRRYQAARAVTAGPASTSAAGALSTPRAKTTAAALQTIQDDISDRIEAGDPTYADIFVTSTTGADAKVAVGTRTATPALLADLERRYGANRVTVWLKPDQPVDTFTSRNDDKAPFWGGATIRRATGDGYAQCSSGFAYRIGSYSYMLTAGHCVPDGGTFSAWNNNEPNDPKKWPTVGSVTSGSRENFDITEGTVKLTNGTRFEGGDLALINTSNSGGADPTIYVGGPGSGHYVRVGKVDPTYVGDNFCTGGRTTGELCGWIVDQVNVPSTLGYHGRDLVVKRSIQAHKTRGACIAGGDSGGPVYYLARGDNPEARAKGIISGGGTHRGEPGQPYCTLVFTDIFRSYDAWRGYVPTR